jgi:hypothetical protein
MEAALSDRLDLEFAPAKPAARAVFSQGTVPDDSASQAPASEGIWKRIIISQVQAAINESLTLSHHVACTSEISSERVRQLIRDHVATRLVPGINLPRGEPEYLICEPSHGFLGTTGAFQAGFSFVSERSGSERIFDSIQSLYLSANAGRDRRIADRITALYRVALEEDETMRADSLAQFAAFFLRNPSLGFPKITLTPDGTLRARWIRGAGDFMAIEFTGEALVRGVAEIPREGETARHFFSEPVRTIVDVARGLGVSFA